MLFFITNPLQFVTTVFQFIDPTSNNEVTNSNYWTSNIWELPTISLINTNILCAIP